VARFARQSSLMRAPQLIRGVVRTLEALAGIDEFSSRPPAPSVDEREA
jgi:hypothetical protein